MIRGQQYYSSNTGSIYKITKKITVYGSTIVLLKSISESIYIAINADYFEYLVNENIYTLQK